MKTLDFIKKKLQPICDPVNFDNLLRTPANNNFCMLFRTLGKWRKQAHLCIYYVTL